MCVRRNKACKKKKIYIYTHTHTHVHTYTHTGRERLILKAEKSHILFSGTWACRKASGIMQFKLESLRTRGADGLNDSPRAGGDEMQ